MAVADYIKIEAGKLMVNMAIDAKGKESATGKTIVHGSTHGFTRIDGTKYRVNIVLTSEK